MNSREIQEYKKQLKLTQDQKDILVGLLLGDGHLETRNNGRTYRLKVEHSLNQEDYVLWIYEHFKEWAPSGLFYKERKNGQKSVGFTTYSHGAFRFYGHQFYEGKKKKIPKLIHKMLTEIGIAIWFMDDGSRKSSQHNTYIIHYLGFSKEDLERVRFVFLNSFEIHTSLHLQKEKYWRLYIPSKSSKKFSKIIEPYVLKFSSMKHKLSNIMPKE